MVPRTRSLALTLLITLFLVPLLRAQYANQTGPDLQDDAEAAAKPNFSSPYIPLDSWIYPAAIRLYELGYLPTAYLGLRPWTRASLAHMLQMSTNDMEDPLDDPEAVEIYARLRRELVPEFADTRHQAVAESIYTRITGIGGPIINDSFHLGQTIVNDYGRPYQHGFDNISGYSARASYSRFSLYVRGEYQRAPASTGYSTAVFNALDVDDTDPGNNPALFPNPSIPTGSIPIQNNIRILEANLAAHLLNNEISFGKSDAWLGSAYGGSFAWSNNAENIYSFRINRVEPLYIPWLSRYTGMFRYDFFVGSLKGHTAPNDPWIHAEKISFKPLADLEFGFMRSVIWGGKGHAPITIGSFLRSFFSTTAGDVNKFTRNDPGARFSTFDVTWRVPWNDHLVTLYADSLAHDNVFPVSNPGRSGWRPGIYFARLPGLDRVDLRFEGVTTNIHDPESNQGKLLYWELVQVQGYTNKSQVLGDWIGRESTGGQVWITWHQKPDESLQFEYRRNKAATDFIPGGTIQQQFAVHEQLRLTRDLELKANLQSEFWKAPLIASGLQKDYVISAQFTYYPHLSSATKK